MKKKYKLLLVIFALVALVFGSGITYSIFTSEGVLSGNQGVAKFIFKTKKLDHIELPITDMNPKDVDEYKFEVVNNEDTNKSEVTVEYNISIKTPHLMPLSIELYKTVNDSDELLMTCDETRYSRNSNNELVCNSSVQELNLSKETPDNYKVKVSFLEDYKDESYSNLIDYIDLDINSWQKIATGGGINE